MRGTRGRRHASRRVRDGFTLIELVVVVGILVVITASILANYSQFGGKILLRNLAYDMALSIRQAQVFGISARRFGGAEFSVGHGIFIDLTAPNGSAEYHQFTDADRDGFYDVGGSAEWVRTYTLGRRYSIETLCARVTGAATETCGFHALNMLFKRPEPDAIMHVNDGSGYVAADSVRIVLRSPRDDRVTVLVESTGQISVQRYTP